MSEPGQSETISIKDRKILDKHRKIAENYSPGGNLDWWKVAMQELPHEAQGIADTIVSAGILPKPLNSNEKPLLVSLSSNSGLNEKVLAEKLKSYKVIAGDISGIERVPSEALPVRLDASFLPFQPNSIAGMLDIRGAIWHEANEDLENGFNKSETSAENLLEIFTRLRTSLQVGGVLIIDDPEYFPKSASGTAVKIDQLLRDTGEKIEGFEVSRVGKLNRRLRVYKKVS